MRCLLKKLTILIPKIDYVLLDNYHRDNNCIDSLQVNIIDDLINMSDHHTLEIKLFLKNANMSILSQDPIQNKSPLISLNPANKQEVITILPKLDDPITQEEYTRLVEQYLDEITDGDTHDINVLYSKITYSLTKAYSNLIKTKVKRSEKANTRPWSQELQVLKKK